MGQLEKWLGGRFVSVVLQQSRLADWPRVGGAKLEDNVPCLRLPGLDSTTLAFSGPIPDSHPSRTCTPRNITSSTDRQFIFINSLSLMMAQGLQMRTGKRRPVSPHSTLHMKYVLLTLHQHPVVDIVAVLASAHREDWKVQVVQHGVRGTGKYPNGTFCYPI